MEPVSGVARGAAQRIPRRAAFLDLKFDQLTLDGAIRWITARTSDDPFAYVVTPNVDHMVRLDRLSGDLKRAYLEADLCLCDSRILRRIAGWLGVPLTLVPGSDLTAALFAGGFRPGDRIALIGGGAAHGDALRALHPKLDIVQHIPPMGLLHDRAARAAAIAFASEVKARAILLAVGAPQQELIAYEMRESGRVAGTALCIGASVDFLVGGERRAPRIVQRVSMEWAWRMAGNPQRLAYRYLIKDPAIFPIAWRWARRRGRR